MEKKELLNVLDEHKAAIDEKLEEIAKAKNDEVEKLKTDLAEMEKTKGEITKQLEEMDVEIQKASKLNISKKEEEMNLQASFKQLIKSDDFKAALKEGFPKDRNTFEVKADTGDITGTINMTRQNRQVSFAPERQLAFLPNIGTGQALMTNQNRVMWVEGTYTSNVGYVDEGTAASTGDAGTATEKTRGMAKFSAKLVLTEELLEDADYIASAFRLKMQDRAMKWLDGEIYDGDGSDGVNPNHIYGIKGHATAFDSTVLPEKIAKANIGDLIDACILQGEVNEENGLDKLWINPKDFSRYKFAKDGDGQYLFVKDTNGNYTVNGLKVVKTTRVAEGDMLIADSAKIQLWWKRNMSVKFTQMSSDDVEKDQYRAILFGRNQIVIEGVDTNALIYVNGITAALQAIDSTSN